MNFWQRHKTAILYIVMTIFCFFMIVFTKAGFTFSFKKLYSVVLYPFQYGTMNISRAIKNAYISIAEISRLQDELNETREKLLHYEDTATEYEEIRRENERLKELLEVQKDIEYRTILASIVAKDPQNFYSTIVVNRGSSHGVQVNMPVISYVNAEKAVVGKVVEVASRYSKIAPLLSESCEIGGMLEEQRNTGILSGQAPKTFLCRMRYVDRNIDVPEAERVITSGMGGVFPKGILIGSVFDVDKKNYGLFQDVYVKPAVDLSILEDVFIIALTSDEEIRDLFEEANL